MRRGWGGRPVRVEQAQGIMVAALGVLARHYRYEHADRDDMLVQRFQPTYNVRCGIRVMSAPGLAHREENVYDQTPVGCEHQQQAAAPR